MISTGDFLIVGIGASAGGIGALQAFFRLVPTDSGIAYVIILHLSPDHDSHLAEILQSVSSIAVSQVTEQVRVEPNHVYVVPPNQHLAMHDGSITVSPNMTTEDRRAPVDIFFRTLAESHQHLAVSVILSGTGANGSMGLKRVKERGGVVFVQNPREAEFSEMPRNAIATNIVDDILPVAEIPARIIAYKERLSQSKVDISRTQGNEDGEVIIETELTKPLVLEEQQALRKIFGLLRTETGHDFSNYKLPTLLRRIERRMNVCNLPNIVAYAELAAKDSKEVQLLLKDLLISVTHFFRNKESFELLEHDILPKIFQNKTSADQVRIWVAGCATGEEAYSLAILCAERVLDEIDAPRVQIFATDIDEVAIAHAREGLYTLNDAADVSPERLRDFFTKEDNRFRVRREIREMVLFANHNVIKDAPFAQLDLVSCRNLLIYLNATAQERVLDTFHFALKPSRYLFLGGSEMPVVVGDLYNTVSREHHIFQSRPTSGRLYPLPESFPTLRPAPLSVSEDRTDAGPRSSSPVALGELHQKLLEQYAPPSLIVNEAYEILHLSEKAARYLEVTGGEFTNNLLVLIRQELRLGLQTALYQAVERQSNVEVKGQTVNIEGRVEVVNLQVRPALGQNNAQRGCILILFEPADLKSPSIQPVLASDEPMMHQMHDEILQLKIQLRKTGDQHELQAEALKASNEEYQAINEELRSAAEELETSKEELQSINEELRTVNQELKIRIDEITLVNDNLQNLARAVDIGTLFLDRSFRINLFTPIVSKIFNLIAQDIHRPLSDITHRLTYQNVLVDAAAVLETLQPVQREVQTIDGYVYRMRVLPYRTSEDRIQGVIITFVDINELKKIENALRDSQQSMRLLIESATEYAIFTTSPHGIINMWNLGAERLFGWTSEEALGQSIEMVYTPEDRSAGVLMGEMTLARETGNAPDERFHLRKDGSRFYVSGVLSALIHDNQLAGFVKIARDLTKQQEVEQQVRDARDWLEQRVQERTAELNETNELRRELLRKLVTAHEEERTRIARELHDHTGQHLAVTMFSLAALQKMSLPEEAQAILNELVPNIHTLTADIRSLIQGIRPPLLDSFGLEEALQDMVQKWGAWSKIPVKVDFTNATLKRLPTEIETTIYRIVQEALTNVVRHAKSASQVDVYVVQDVENINVSVRDNGAGFNPEKLASVPVRSRRLGIVGMQERAKLMGGTLALESKVNHGTTLTLSIPVAQVALEEPS